MNSVSLIKQPLYHHRSATRVAFKFTILFCLFAFFLTSTMHHPLRFWSPYLASLFLVTCSQMISQRYPARPYRPAGSIAWIPRSLLISIDNYRSKKRLLQLLRNFTLISPICQFGSFKRAYQSRFRPNSLLPSRTGDQMHSEM